MTDSLAISSHCFKCLPLKSCCIPVTLAVRSPLFIVPFLQRLIFLVVRVPCTTGILELWSHKCRVRGFFHWLWTVPQIASNKSIFYFCHQASDVQRSFWGSAASSSKQIVPYDNASSAKILTVELRPSGKSFIYIKNSNSPKTVRWGNTRCCDYRSKWCPLNYYWLGIMC